LAIDRFNALVDVARADALARPRQLFQAVHAALQALGSDASSTVR
jgi:hypothetical protein